MPYLPPHALPAIRFCCLHTLHYHLHNTTLTPTPHRCTYSLGHHTTTFCLHIHFWACSFPAGSHCLPLPAACMIPVILCHLGWRLHSAAPHLGCLPGAWETTWGVCCHYTCLGSWEDKSCTACLTMGPVMTCGAATTCLLPFSQDTAWPTLPGLPPACLLHLPTPLLPAGPTTACFYRPLGYLPTMQIHHATWDHHHLPHTAATTIGTTDYGYTGPAPFTTA